DVGPRGVTLTPASASLNENDVLNLSGSFTDPTAGQTHTVTLHWGDGSADSTISLAAGVFSFGTNHRYLDNGSDTVTATVADSTGAQAIGTATVHVANVAPANVTLTPAPGTINENDTPSLSGSFTDPGTLDTHTVSIDWGDGSTPTTVNLAAG